jgi:class 3 adenylate cyclase
MDVEQRFKITNLTFLFTDLKGSTELYDRLGDLAAFDLIREHFRALNSIVSQSSGAVVKTIGDAIMAAFPSPAQGITAALNMRHAMADLNEKHGRENIILKIGVHTGSCLAVMLNERQDYFGQTVNVASRVQNLASTNVILTTADVVEDTETRRLIEQRSVARRGSTANLRGIGSEVSVYEIG